jgi:transcriptional regulator with XRE-family HTH domain
MQDYTAAEEEAFSRLFGQNLRQARTQKGWSQRRLAEELDSRGLKLDPSAVTRIELGSRVIKLQEAAVAAECLGVDLQELMKPAGADPLAIALELLKNAEVKVNAGRTAFAEMALSVRSAEAFLQMHPELVEELCRLRGLDETRDAHAFLAQQLQAITSGSPAVEVPDAEDRLLKLLQQTVSAAVEDMFTGDGPPGTVVEERSEHGSDAEA